MKIIIILLISIVSSQMAGGYSEKPVTELEQSNSDIYKYVLSVVKERLPECSFQRISKFSTQVVSGTNYRLDLYVDCSGTQKLYRMVIYDQPWTSTRRVSSFEEIKDVESFGVWVQTSLPASIKELLDTEFGVYELTQTLQQGAKYLVYLTHDSKHYKVLLFQNIADGKIKLIKEEN